MKRFTENQLKKLTFTGILVLTLVVAGSALAQGPGMGQGKGGMGRGMGQGLQANFDGDFGPRSEMRLERMAARLDLSEEQTEAIAKIREEGRKQNMEIRKEMMRLRNELRGEMLKDDPSKKTALDLNGKLGELRTQKQANRLENRLEVRELLTQEQKDKMLLMGDFGKGNRGGRGGFQKGHRGAGCGHFGDFGPRRGQGQGSGPRFGDPDCPNYNR